MKQAGVLRDDGLSFQYNLREYGKPTSQSKDNLEEVAQRCWLELEDL